MTSVCLMEKQIMRHTIIVFSGSLIELSSKCLSTVGNNCCSKSGVVPKELSPPVTNMRLYVLHDGSAHVQLYATRTVHVPVQY